MSEIDVSEDQVREEHLRDVKVMHHWIYLFAVLVGAFLLMVGFIAILGATK